jgi:hypothetical protein
MPLTDRVRLGPGVRWRTFPDGAVAYVPATCETHLLTPACEPLLDALAQAVAAEPPEGATGPAATAPGSGAEPPPGPDADPGELLPSLLALKIVVPRP